MSFSTLRYLGFGSAALVLIGSVYACGASSEDQSVFSTGTGGTTTNDSGTAGGKTDASAGSAGVAGSGQGGAAGGFLLDASIGDGAMNAETACVASHVDAVPIPLDLYFMVDRSGSMQGEYWTNQSAALKSFFSDPQSAGLWVALRFFPQDSGDTSPNCDGTLFAIPTVNWGELPGVAGSLASAIDGTGPTGVTPTQDALNGVLKGARDRQIQKSDHLVAAVMVSDGAPCCNDCPIDDDDYASIGAIAAKYANGTPSIKTFSIFVDPVAHGVMDAIAKSGGTNLAFDATSGKQAFIDALNSIKKVALSCEYKIPETDAGKIDPSKVNVAFTAGADAGVDAGVEQILKVDDQAACNDGPGWYYDNNTNPTQIKLCPASCDQAKKDAAGRVEILLGCKSETR
jgi:hypothetical protein